MTNSISYLIKHKLLSLPMLASEHGSKVDDLIVYVHALMAALFVGWLAYFLYCLVRFRKARNPRADYVGVKGHMSSYLELGVAFVEAVLLIGFAVPLWAQVVSNPPSQKDSTVINILGRQFNWNGHYAGVDGLMGSQNPALVTSSDPYGMDRKGDEAAKDDVIVLGTIVVPADRNVILNITSMDVIHSFAVRAMRVCQDATPGLRVSTWFKPVKVGEYRITCAQLCGNGHYNMSGILKVIPQEEFDQWMAEQSAKARSQADPVSYE